ncbi:MAG: metal ABC transporter substrate-binding protein [Chloroflexota bacterium]|nr:metal ABC transporter substrate-binding protein [Chloroflexota bacterium]
MKPCRILLFVLLVPFLASCNSSAPGGDKALRVVSTVSPITNIVYNVGGDRIRLQGIVPEGTNSHTFEPAPSDARKLAQADVIFVNGLHLEEPMLKLAEANKRATAEIVQLGERTITPNEYVYDFSFPRAQGSPNPHLWMNPLYALRYAQIVRDTLVRSDPEGESYYRGNYTLFEQRLQALDAVVRRTVQTIPADHRRLLTYHDSFAYFASRYGMRVIGAIQPADFSEPSSREVAALIGQLREQRVPAIFGSEVFPSKVLNQIAREAGVRYVDSLRDDDLPGRPGEPKHSYVGLLAQDVEVMARALGGNPALISGVDTRNVPGQDQRVSQPQ